MKASKFMDAQKAPVGISCRAHRSLATSRKLTVGTISVRLTVFIIRDLNKTISSLL